MKNFIYTLIVLALGLLVFNLLQIDFSDMSSQKSTSALIGVLSSLCVIVVMLILRVSRKIKEKADKK